MSSIGLRFFSVMIVLDFLVVGCCVVGLVVVCCVYVVCVGLFLGVMDCSSG